MMLRVLYVSRLFKRVHTCFFTCTLYISGFVKDLRQNIIFQTMCLSNYSGSMLSIYLRLNPNFESKYGKKLQPIRC